MADKIFSFEGNGEVRQYAGNYTDYRQYAEQLQQSAADQSRETEKQNRNEKREVKKDRPLKFTYREQKEFEQIDGIIEALEKKLQRITLEMNDTSSDFQKLQIVAEGRCGKQLEDIERWTYLNELYEKIREVSECLSWPRYIIWAMVPRCYSMPEGITILKTSVNSV